MTRQQSFPDPVLAEAIEAVLPLTRRDMTHEEVVEYLEAHPQTLRDKLRQMGVPPDHYEDLPSIVEAADPTTRAIALMSSTGPLWSLPCDPADDDDLRCDG